MVILNQKKRENQTLHTHTVKTKFPRPNARIFQRHSLHIKRLMNEVVHTSPTIGSNVEEIVLQKTHFLMWDIGGQEALRSTWNTYYSNTEVEKGIKMQRGSESLRPDQFSVGLTSGWCRGWSGSTVGRRHAHQRKSPPLTVPLCWPVHHPCD
ncbi:putative ADP-ribosylation factor-like protein 5C isoform X5 [Panthera leo]|uniref:putative ADP-ribosylation factor-like protein 5C isoform X5 n=1 Tax=Panthera leo TaxID=9689 RepID=UPI001C6A1622|nr:putative ADP-ribosylation factor-like protein 5C isoform X5 [Panthera leo]